MKKIAGSILLVTCCMLLQTRVFCDIYTDAIAKLDTNMAKYIADASTAGNRQLVDLLNAIFVNTPSVLDVKLRKNIEDFFSIYTTKKDFTSFDLATISETNKLGLDTLLAKEIGYNTQRNSLEKSRDAKGLLIQPFENQSNDFDASSVQLFDAPYTPYRSMADEIPSAQDAPNLSDLIGIDGYKDDEKDKAKLFISYILSAMPAPKNFVIPDISTAQNNKVYMYLPIADNEAGTPYTYKEISTSVDSEKYKDAPPGESKVEYDRMVAYLKKDNSLYQPYKMKVRVTNVLRTLYTESLYHAYQDRVKDSSGLSLVEKEKLVALYGLNKSYYETLVNGNSEKGIGPATLADVAIEALRAVNTLSYFIYRIHQDIERLTLVTATSGMQTLGSLSAIGGTKYIAPISKLIKASCWDRNIFPSDDKRLLICGGSGSTGDSGDNASSDSSSSSRNTPDLPPPTAREDIELPELPDLSSYSI
jgi:hypothetical protein